MIIPDTQKDTAWFTAPALSQSLPTSFRLEQQRFFKSVTPCAYFGREKGVCDELQRHPLINSIFSTSPQPSPKRRGLGWAISIPFAREYLHLVIPYGTQPLFSAIKL